MPFTDFLFHLRAHGLKVATMEWLAFLDAVVRGHTKGSVTGLYHVARALLVKRERELDVFDRAFAEYFEGLEASFSIDDELLKWLEHPHPMRALTDEEKALLEALDIDALRERFEERLREQKERHDGGNRHIGTGGTSPFGHGGTHPTGVRVGGTGGGRTAVQVASDRRFESLRTDRTLDIRQLSLALRRLRRLSRQEGAFELDLEGTIDKTARDAGEIDLVFQRPRTNKLRVLLLVDVGGSMDPHAELVERLFSAAHQAKHFRSFQAYSFHNCVYETLYTDISRGRGVRTADVLKNLDEKWTTILVGDAWMSPFELTHASGAIHYGHRNAVSGIEWLRRIKLKTPKAVWLNPEPPRMWHAQSIALVKSVFPMYELTLDGLNEAIDVLRGARAA